MGFFDIVGDQYQKFLKSMEEYTYKQEFLDAASEAVSTSLDAGITPDYLFIDSDFFPGNRPTEFCGLKLWETRLPEEKKIIAVRVQSSTQKVNEE